MLANDDTVAVVERGGVANLGIVDERAVAAAQINDRVVRAIVAQERMTARGQLIILQNNFAGGRAADGDVLASQRILARRLAHVLQRPHNNGRQPPAILLLDRGRLRIILAIGGWRRGVDRISPGDIILLSGERETAEFTVERVCLRLSAAM